MGTLARPHPIAPASFPTKQVPVSPSCLPFLSNSPPPRSSLQTPSCRGLAYRLTLQPSHFLLRSIRPCLASSLSCLQDDYQQPHKSLPTTLNHDDRQRDPLPVSEHRLSHDASLSRALHSFYQQHVLATSR